MTLRYDDMIREKPTLEEYIQFVAERLTKLDKPVTLKEICGEFRIDKDSVRRAIWTLYGRGRVNFNDDFLIYACSPPSNLE